MNAHAPSFQPDDADATLVERILAPLPFGSSCGDPLHADPVFTDIRLLREEDDPGLPMGQWERPLKLADWDAVAARCVEQLCTRSKHLRLAAWLAEAWTRQRGLAGLRLGLTTLDALLRRHWPQLHPMIDADGDAELRLAPLEWLDKALAHALHVHVSLLELPGEKMRRLTLAEWERLAARDLDDTQSGARAQETAPCGRKEVLEHARQAPASLQASRALIKESMAALAGMRQVLAEAVGDAAPSMESLSRRLGAADRMLSQLASERHDGLACSSIAQAAPAALDADGDGDPGDGVPAAAHTPLASGWRNRGEAYACLKALAEYLAEIEPHSPVPFLIRRAVQWGSMPLPELIAELIRQEGDLNRLVSFLDIGRER